MIGEFLSRATRRAKAIWGERIARWRGTSLTDYDLLSALEMKFESVEVFAGYFKNRSERLFFLPETDRRQSLVTAFLNDFPETGALTIRRADEICAHIFDLLGSGPIYLGEKIDWHIDFKTGYRFDPKRYYAFFRPAPFPGGYDIKLPWELSRCQHFAWLGQAYWFSQDEKYASEFVNQAVDWILQNPVQFGVNWACTMDVALRAINWLWGYFFFADSPSLDDPFRALFLKSMLSHGRFIWNNLEVHGKLKNNHYLSNLLGLIYLGILFPEFREAKQWKEFGMRELEIEMSKQVYLDGVNFEASTGYHRLAVELFLSAALLARLHHQTFSDGFMARLELMIEFVFYATKPDGTMPLIGDNDNGRVHRLKVWGNPDREWNDYRYLFAIGALLFQRQDFALAAGDQWEEAAWFYGQKAWHAMIRVQDTPAVPVKSCSFPASGYYFIRHDDLYLCLDAGPIGQNGIGGHAHNDIFSFEFCAGGQTWIVDPGTVSYTGDYLGRNISRSTASHNTVSVDGCEQNRFDPEKIFAMKDDAQVQVTRWEDKEDYIWFEGFHTGFYQLSKPAKHKRILFLDRKEKVMIVFDSLDSPSGHLCQSCLYLEPALEIITNDRSDEVRLVSPDGVALAILLLTPPSERVCVRNGWVSPGYGSKKPASQIYWHWNKSSIFALGICENTDENIIRIRASRAQDRMLGMINA